MNYMIVDYDTLCLDSMKKSACYLALTQVYEETSTMELNHELHFIEILDYSDI